MWKFVLRSLAFWTIVLSQTDVPSTTRYSIDLNPSTGNCSNIDGYKVQKKTMYNGRWYGVYNGMAESQARRSSCLVFDNFFDQKGFLHDFFLIKQDGIWHGDNSTATPIDEKNGIYEFDNNYNATLYYVNKHLLVRLLIRCIDNIPYRSFIVAYRDLKYVPTTEKLVRTILQRIGKAGGLDGVSKISYKNCSYPPPMKNPFE